MSTIQCNIVSAEKEIFSENVTMVVATGSMGELGITPGHSQLLTGIKPGPVKIVKEGGEEEVFFLSESAELSIFALLPSFILLIDTPFAFSVGSAVSRTGVGRS